MLLIQATNDFYYTDPIFIGKDWFLECNEDGVFANSKIYHNTTRESAQTRLRREIKRQGIKIDILKYVENRQTVFPPFYLDMEEAIIFKTIILSPIPKPSLYGNRLSSPVFDYPLLAWEMVFDTKDLMEFFNPNGIKNKNRMVAKFLMGDTTYSVDEKTIREKLTECLPGISRYKRDPLKWFENKPDQIRLIKK
jgi:hypothetical protein